MAPASQRTVDTASTLFAGTDSRMRPPEGLRLSAPSPARAAWSRPTLTPCAVRSRQRTRTGALVVEDQHRPATGRAHGRRDQFPHPGNAVQRGADRQPLCEPHERALERSPATVSAADDERVIGVPAEVKADLAETRLERRQHEAHRQTAAAGLSETPARPPHEAELASEMIAGSAAARASATTQASRAGASAASDDEQPAERDFTRAATRGQRVEVDADGLRAKLGDHARQLGAPAGRAREFRSDDRGAPDGRPQIGSQLQVQAGLVGFGAGQRLVKG